MNTLLDITIRQGQLDDLVQLQKLFVETVTSVCSKDYNESQIKVWTASVENKERWLDIFTNQHLLVAEYKNQIVGFCSLDKGFYVDFLYVHKDYQGKGIASRLYNEIEKTAKQQNRTQLVSDVSKTAKPFFEKLGFKTVKEQTVIRQQVELINFKMEKTFA